MCRYGVRFVSSKKLGRENDVPRQASVLRLRALNIVDDNIVDQNAHHVYEQSHIPVRKRREYQFLPQSGQPFYRIWISCSVEFGIQ